jgi:hypothetical protein
MHSSENRAFAIFGRDAQSKNLSGTPLRFCRPQGKRGVKQKQIPRAPLLPL